MSMSEVSRDDWSLVPPPDVLLLRPTWVRLLANTATMLWWAAGLVAASCAGMLVAEPVLSRPIVLQLLIGGGIAFVGALITHGIAAYATAGLVARDLDAREEAARRAWYAEPRESVAVLEAVAEEFAADAAEAAAEAAVRAAQLAATVAQDASAEAAAAPDADQIRDAARRAVEAADVAAFVVGQIPAARRATVTEESPDDRTDVDGWSDGDDSDPAVYPDRADGPDGLRDGDLARAGDLARDGDGPGDPDRVAGADAAARSHIDLSSALRHDGHWFDDEPAVGRFGYDPSYDPNVLAAGLPSAERDAVRDEGYAPRQG